MNREGLFEHYVEGKGLFEFSILTERSYFNTMWKERVI